MRRLPLLAVLSVTLLQGAGALGVPVVGPHAFVWELISVTPQGNAADPAIATWGDRVGVAWQHYDGGWSFEMLVRVGAQDFRYSRPGSELAYAEVAFDEDGRFHVFRTDAARKQAIVTTFDGSAWQDRVIATGNTVSIYTGAYVRDGTVYAMFPISATGGGGTVRPTFFRLDANDVWTHVTTFPEIRTLSHFAVDSAHRIHVVSLNKCSVYDNGTWSPTQVLPFTTFMSSDLDVDADNQAHFVFDQRNQDGFWYARPTQTGYEFVELADRRMQQERIRIAPDGTVHAMGTTAYSLGGQHHQPYNGMNAIYARVDETGVSSTMFFPMYSSGSDITLDENGSPVLAMPFTQPQIGVGLTPSQRPAAGLLVGYELPGGAPGRVK